MSKKCHVLFECPLNTFVHSNEEIGEIEKIACVIDDIPPDRKEVVQLPENYSADFINVFTISFYTQRSGKHKNLLELAVFLHLWDLCS